MIKIIDNRDKFVLNKKYYVDEQYFCKINTRNKAYILGLIAADGGLSKTTNTIRIVLKNSPSEEEILQNIIKDMKFTGTYSYIKNNQSLELTITSFRLKDQLIALGIVPNKTLYLDLQKVIDNVPNEFKPDFLRGYFDGDGCISISQQKYKNSIYNIPTFHITVLTKNVEALISLFNTDFKFTISKEKRTECDISYVKACARYKIKFIYDLMYTDDCICLKRKRDIFEDYLNIK